MGPYTGPQTPPPAAPHSSDSFHRSKHTVLIHSHYLLHLLAIVVYIFAVQHDECLYLFTARACFDVITAHASTSMFGCRTGRVAHHADWSCVWLRTLHPTSLEDVTDSPPSLPKRTVAESLGASTMVILEPGRCPAPSLPATTRLS